MTEPVAATIRKILVATDLTPRYDRALDRAVQLARESQAELVAVHVMDAADQSGSMFDRRERSWRRVPDPAERMRWRSQRDLAEAFEGIRVIAAQGDPAEQLVAHARSEACDLIVTGAASAESMSRILFGSTVNCVAREVEQPILVVHDRAFRPYRGIVVATDFSDASIAGLQTAWDLFPQAAFTLFHAYDIPSAALADARQDGRALLAMQEDMMAKVRADDRLDARLRGKVSVVADFGALIGSTAKRLVEALEGDLLIVRHPADA